MAWAGRVCPRPRAQAGQQAMGEHGEPGGHLPPTRLGGPRVAGTLEANCEPGVGAATQDHFLSPFFKQSPALPSLSSPRLQCRGAGDLAAYSGVRAPGPQTRVSPGPHSILGVLALTGARKSQALGRPQAQSRLQWAVRRRAIGLGTLHSTPCSCRSKSHALLCTWPSTVSQKPP